MGASALTLTVFFEDPFWVGTFERYCGGALCVAKVTFGAEPKDSEVYAAWLGHWNELEFSPPLRGIKPMGHAANPKRMQRAAAAEVKRQGIGTKAQQALKMQYEQTKDGCKKLRREQTEAEKERKFELRQQKKKEKHRGR